MEIIIGMMVLAWVVYEHKSIFQLLLGLLFFVFGCFALLVLCLGFGLMWCIDVFLAWLHRVIDEPINRLLG